MSERGQITCADIIGLVLIMATISLFISFYITRHVFCADHHLSGQACEDAFIALQKDGLRP